MPFSMPQWIVQDVSDGGITLRNLKNNNYVGVEGEPREGEAIVGRVTPTEFHVEPTDEPQYVK
jgi:hypothetical protein